MNKKSLMMLLFAATLGLTSCNDIQELNLNFGDRTYVNEYEGLIAAVNNLSATLKERFDALSELLKKGMLDLKVSIDENTGAINIVGQNIATLDGDIKDGLGTINTTLFNGFKAVTTQIDETGKTIVAAMDENGNLLRLQIDETGKLISAQLITSTADLIKAMNDNNASIAEKLGLIDAALKAGFASTAQGQEDIRKAITEAMAALSAEVKAGSKSNADALKELKDAITTLTASLDVKLAAIDAALKAGLADIVAANGLIKEAIDALAAEVKAGNISNAEALAEIKAAIASQTTSLAEKIALVQSAIATGFANENTTLASMTNELKTAIDNLKTEVYNGNTNNATYLAQLVSGLSALNTTTGTTNTKLGEIKDELTKQLADNGVTINNDGKSVYVTPDVWAQIEQGGTSSQLYNVFMEAIQTVTIPNVKDPIQVTPGAPSSWHHCAVFVNDGYDASTVALRAGTLQPTTSANGKTVIKVIKTPSEVKFHIANLDGCTYKWLYNIRVYDARGDYQVFGGTYGNQTGSRAQIGEATSLPYPNTQTHGDNITIRLMAYDNGRICEDIKAYVFSYVDTNNLPALFWPSNAPSN